MLQQSFVGSSEQTSHGRLTSGAIFFSFTFTALLWGIDFHFQDNPKFSSLEYPAVLRHVESVTFISFVTLLAANILAYLVENQDGMKVQLIYSIYIKFLCSVTGYMTATDRMPLLRSWKGTLVNPGRHLIWIFTTPVFILMADSRLSSHARKSNEVNFAIAADIVMLLFGFGAEIAPTELATVCHVLAYVAFMYVGSKVSIIFQRAIAEESVILTFAARWCQVVWCIFPCIATLRFMHVIDDNVAEAAFSCSHLLSKCVFTALMVQDYCLSESDRESIRLVKEEEANQKILLAQLEELVRQKDSFLSSTSHELRTPIHGIIGLAQSLLTGSYGPLDESSTLKLNAIKECGSQLHLIISNILKEAACRSSSISKEAELVRVELLPIVSGCVGAVSSCLSNQIQLEVDRATLGDLPAVLGDERHIRQIVYNLLMNAVKFTVAGKVSVFGETVRSEKGPFIKISVQDTGVGIPDSEISNIFKPFSQEEIEEGLKLGRAGMGLSVVKNLVEVHGGEVFASSEFGVGSIFSFTIPIPGDDEAFKEQETIDESFPPSDIVWNTLEISSLKDQMESVSENTEQDVQSPSPCSSVSQGNTSCTKSQKQVGVKSDRVFYSNVHNVPLVLIVDQDQSNQTELAFILEAAKIRVQMAHSSRNASAFLRKCELWPDLILLDSQILFNSNFELCKAWLAEFKSFPVPIIALCSQSVTMNDRESNLFASASTYGVVDFIPKPFEEEGVLHRVRFQLCVRQIPSHRDMQTGKETEACAAMPRESHFYWGVTVMAIEVLGVDLDEFDQDLNGVEILLTKLYKLIEDTLKSHEVLQVESSAGGCVCLAGYVESDTMHAYKSFKAAQAVIACVDAVRVTPLKPTIKVGIHLGPVFATTVGQDQKCYIFGKTVSFARHLVKHGYANAIHMSQETAAVIDRLCAINSDPLSPTLDRISTITSPALHGPELKETVLITPLPALSVDTTGPEVTITPSPPHSPWYEETVSLKTPDSASLEYTIQETNALLALVSESRAALDSQTHKLQNHIEDLVSSQHQVALKRISSMSDHSFQDRIRMKRVKELDINLRSRSSSDPREHATLPMTRATAHAAPNTKMQQAVSGGNYGQKIKRRSYSFLQVNARQGCGSDADIDETATAESYGKHASTRRSPNISIPSNQRRASNSTSEECDLVSISEVPIEHPGSTIEIDHFLETLGLGHYVQLFEANGIDMAALQRLDDEQLKHVGVKTIGARMRILFGVQDYRSGNQEGSNMDMSHQLSHF